MPARTAPTAAGRHAPDKVEAYVVRVFSRRHLFCFWFFFSRALGSSLLRTFVLRLYHDLLGISGDAFLDWLVWVWGRVVIVVSIATSLSLLPWLVLRLASFVVATLPRLVLFEVTQFYVIRLYGFRTIQWMTHREEIHSFGFQVVPKLESFQ